MPIGPYKKERLITELKRLAAEFVRLEVEPRTFVTITEAHVDDKLSSAVINFTVFPESHEKNTLHILKRKEKMFRSQAMENIRFHTIPHVTFMLDIAEKTRQKLDATSKQK